jgi:hypothetical protein
MHVLQFLQKIKSLLKVDISKPTEFDVSEKTESNLVIDKNLLKKHGNEQVLFDFNQILYNAGFSFQVDSINPKQKEILILGSFDFSYYVQLHIQFFGVCFTTLSDDEYWNDAWYGDQLSILAKEDRARLLKKHDLSISDSLFVLKFHSHSVQTDYERIIIAERMSYNFFDS